MGGGRGRDWDRWTAAARLVLTAQSLLLCTHLHTVAEMHTCRDAQLHIKAHCKLLISLHTSTLTWTYKHLHNLLVPRVFHRGQKWKIFWKSSKRGYFSSKNVHCSFLIILKPIFYTDTYIRHIRDILHLCGQPTAQLVIAPHTATWTLWLAVCKKAPTLARS